MTGRVSILECPCYRIILAFSLIQSHTPFVSLVVVMAAPTNLTRNARSSTIPTKASGSSTSSIGKSKRVLVYDFVENKTRRMTRAKFQKEYSGKSPSLYNDISSPIASQAFDFPKQRLTMLVRIRCWGDRHNTNSKGRIYIGSLSRRSESCVRERSPHIDSHQHIVYRQCTYSSDRLPSPHAGFARSLSRVDRCT